MSDKRLMEITTVFHIDIKTIVLNALCNSSNTSRRTSSDFQTPRRVEIARPSIFNELRGVLKSEEVLLTSIWTYFSNYPVFLEKIDVKFGLGLVISSSDFQTSSTLLIFFVSGLWIVNDLRIVTPQSVDVLILFKTMIIPIFYCRLYCIFDCCGCQTQLNKLYKFLSTYKL